MTAPSVVIDLVSGIQRRRDFGAHVTGFVIGTALLVTLVSFDGALGRIPLALLAILTWATALSCQHFRQVLRGPVTPEDVRNEADRIARASAAIGQTERSSAS